VVKVHDFLGKYEYYQTNTKGKTNSIELESLEMRKLLPTQSPGPCFKHEFFKCQSLRILDTAECYVNYSKTMKRKAPQFSLQIIQPNSKYNKDSTITNYRPISLFIFNPNILSKLVANITELHVKVC
jgi:hypothetical protein